MKKLYLLITFIVTLSLLIACSQPQAAPTTVPPTVTPPEPTATPEPEPTPTEVAEVSDTTESSDTSSDTSEVSAETVAELEDWMLNFFTPLPAESPSDEYELTEELITLGRMLYYDPRLSINQEISCNSCHLLDNFGVDGTATSEGHDGTFGGRNAPTVYNAAFHVAQFWDGRSPTVETQAEGPILNPIEMGMPDEASVVAVVKSIPGYQELFAAAYPDSDDPITYKNLARSIGAFERRLTTPSRFDKFLEGDTTQLTEEEQRGLATFVTTGCTTCHAGPIIGGNLYHKLGLVKPYETEDLGRFEETGIEADKYIFKVPSLRNIAETGPYLHDGSVETLEEIVTIMASHQLGQELSDNQVTDIVTFLNSLTGEVPEEYIAMPTLPENGPDTPEPGETLTTAPASAGSQYEFADWMTNFFTVLPTEATPKDYELTEALITLGRILYYDPRLSINQEISCNSCHMLDQYGIDDTPTSEGHDGTFGDRNSPTVYNAAFHVAQFWDGRSPTVETQAEGPILNPIEMGMPDEAYVVDVINTIPGYQDLFAAAYPDSDDPITYKNLARAIGAFERRLVTPSRFDAFLTGDKSQLNEQELRGLATFVSLGCTTCHAGPNIGGELYRKLGLVVPYDTEDLGRYVETGEETDRYVFKVPSLRNITETGPYLHDGSIETLEEMITLMANHQLAREVTDEQVADIIAFFDSLTGELPQDYIAEPELPESGPDTPVPAEASSNP